MDEQTHVTTIPLDYRKKDRSVFELTSVKNFDVDNEKKPDVNSTQISTNQQTNTNDNKPGFFSRMWNNMGYMWSNFKNYFVTEEEEYIDAHGFKAKRPKHKIPLRKQKDAIIHDTRIQGGEGLSYASQHSPFGRMFL